jgi:hypothetical protein
MKTLLPSGQSTADLRVAAEAALANGQIIGLNPADLLAILVSLDLRERLDPDVGLCARFCCADLSTMLGLEGNHSDSVLNDLPAVLAAAKRVLKHEPLPDLSEAAS